MGLSYYDEIEIEDMSWDADKRVYHYPCPCGDRFEITRAQLAAGEDVAACPSCSLIVRVIYDMLDFEDEDSEPEDDTPSSSTDTFSGDEEDGEFQDAFESLKIDDAAPAADATSA